MRRLSHFVRPWARLWNAADVRRCWLHNLATALTAEQMAIALRLAPDEVYSAGLVHDIGRFVLILKHRGDYVRLLREGPDERRPTSASRSVSCSGRDHTEAGRALLVTLALPPVLGEVAAGHHDVPNQDVNRYGGLRHTWRAALQRRWVLERAGRRTGTAGGPRSQTWSNVVPYVYREPLRKNAQSLKNVVTTLVGALRKGVQLRVLRTLASSGRRVALQGKPKTAYCSFSKIRFSGIRSGWA